MANVLIAFTSYSGNTKEVAEIIADHLEEAGHNTKMVWLDDVSEILFEGHDEFDYYVFGTFTWGSGELPVEWSSTDLLRTLEGKPVSVFGTGDTQFGGDRLYNRAVYILMEELLFEGMDVSNVELTIEQSPRGSQEQEVREWTDGIIRQLESLRE